MKVQKLTANTSIIYADVDKVLTTYTEEQDILLYVGTLRVACANVRIPAYHEISKEQHAEYIIAKEIAQAELEEHNDETPMP